MKMKMLCFFFKGSVSHSFNQGLNGVDFDLSVPEHCLGDELMHAVRHLDTRKMMEEANEAFISMDSV